MKHGSCLPHAHTPSLQRQALGPSDLQVARVRADIADAAPIDALIEAEDNLAELQARLRDLRAMKPATAELVFGADAAWRCALARVGVAAGRAVGQVEALRVAAGGVNPEQVGKPIAGGTSIRSQGD